VLSGAWRFVAFARRLDYFRGLTNNALQLTKPAQESR
jgi:hypothetical protein